MKAYGFIQSPSDPRDIIFSSASSVPSSYRLSNVPPVQDQGSDPVCAAISLSHMINWQERARIGKDVVNKDAIYDIRSDKSMQGMIPRDALKALKKEGVLGYKIKAYSRIREVNSAKAAIQINGPVMVCFNAYSGDVFWKPEGGLMGGHAVILTGWDQSGFVLQNSWGASWGNGGKMILPYEDWKYVIESWTIMV